MRDGAQEGIAILDRPLEENFKVKEKPASQKRTLIIMDPKTPTFVDDLKMWGAVSQQATIQSEYDYWDRNSSTALSSSPQTITTLERDGIRLAIDDILSNNGDNPQTIVVPVPDSEAFSKHRPEAWDYRTLYANWQILPAEKRPQVVMLTQGFRLPLILRHAYQGFLFCDDPQELKKTMGLADRLSDQEAKKVYKPDIVASKQEDAYDNSDLREWENKTSNTYESLKRIIERINLRNHLLQNYSKKRYESLTSSTEPDPIMPEREITTILDLGTGEGRIAGVLARLGFNVMGLDISDEQLRRNRARVVEEGQGLRGEAEQAGLSYNTLHQLQAEGVITVEPNLNDEEVKRRYLTVKDSFFDLQHALNKAVVDWDRRYPESDKYKFFDEYRSEGSYAFSNPKDMFEDIGFDVAMFNWNTFCEVGSPENQKQVLEQILNVLNPGGEIIIEIPDRTLDPYASALETFHTEHPELPYGTIQDPKPVDFKGLETETHYPPRYFPSIDELATTFSSLGFEIDPKNDVQSYLVNGDTTEDGTSQVQREFFITARKTR